MARVVSTGAQDFEALIENNCFYVDKTAFIKEWWESLDIVSLIARPRRFGKTLNINMLDRFWNIKYQGQGDIFQNLSIWQEEKYRKLHCHRLSRNAMSKPCLTTECQKSVSANTVLPSRGKMC